VMYVSEKFWELLVKLNTAKLTDPTYYSV